MLLTIAIGILSVAALGGISLAALHFKSKPVPWPFSIGHGTLGVGGLALLLLAYYQGAQSHYFTIAVITLVAAASGGLFMAYLHQTTGKRLTAVVLIHGAAALVGIGLLATVLLT
jgi:cytochrome b561